MNWRVTFAVAALTTSSGCGDAIVDPGFGGAGLTYVGAYGAYLYVTGFDQGVFVIESATNTVTNIITLPGTTGGVAVGPPSSP